MTKERNLRPRLNDPPFITGKGEDPHSNACLNWRPSNREAICIGYKRATELLTDHVVTKYRDRDTLVYPILFLYRHYFELRLKDLIETCSNLLDRKLEDTSQIHDLWKLWGTVRPRLEELNEKRDGNPYCPQCDIAAAARTLKMLHDVDPTSEAFRYDKNTKGKKLLKNSKHINLRRTRDSLGGLAAFLDAACTVLDEEFECSCECEAEMRANSPETRNRAE